LVTSTHLYTMPHSPE